LPWVLLGLRVAPKEDTGVSAAQVTFGVQLTLPGELLGAPPVAAADLAAKLGQGPQQPAVIPLRSRSYAQVAAELPQALQQAEYVYIRRGGVFPPLAAKFEGPYEVLEKRDKYYVIRVGGKSDSVSVDRLKPYTGVGGVAAALPPKRGRPSLGAAPAGSSGLGG
jgi:hypothetical protein